MIDTSILYFLFCMKHLRQERKQPFNLLKLEIYYYFFPMRKLVRNFQIQLLLNVCISAYCNYILYYIKN